MARVRLGLTSVLVADYDEAIGWYTELLGFELRHDTPLAGGKRWVVVGPVGSQAALLLARAANDDQVARIGDQTGGRVFLFLETDDFDVDHRRLRAAGVRFVEEPRREDYGSVVVFEDLYGNRWDLVEHGG